MEVKNPNIKSVMHHVTCNIQTLGIYIMKFLIPECLASMALCYITSCKSKNKKAISSQVSIVAVLHHKIII